MPPRTTWRTLLPGLIALGALASITIGVLMFAGIGRIRGEKTRLYVVTDQARGVMRGTEVWIAGQKVGVVDGVDFRPVRSDSQGSVVIAVSVRASQAEQVRRDSRAQVHAGANIIGPVVVEITSGTPNSPRVRSGDTVQALAQSDLENAGTKLLAAAGDLEPIMADARVIIGTVRGGNGTVGAMLSGGMGANVRRLRAQVNQLRARFATHDGNGHGDGDGSGVMSVMDRSRGALARVDSIRALLAAPGTSLGRFRRDSSLAPSIGRLRDELTGLRDALSATDGTMARLGTDSALTRSIATAQREMAQLYADIRRRPARYINF